MPVPGPSVPVNGHGVPVSVPVARPPSSRVGLRYPRRPASAADADPRLAVATRRRRNAPENGDSDDGGAGGATPALRVVTGVDGSYGHSVGGNAPPHSLNPLWIPSDIHPFVRDMQLPLPVVTPIHAASASTATAGSSAWTADHGRHAGVLTTPPPSTSRRGPSGSGGRPVRGPSSALRVQPPTGTASGAVSSPRSATAGVSVGRVVASSPVSSATPRHSGAASGFTRLSSPRGMLCHPARCRCCYCCRC